MTPPVAVQAALHDHPIFSYPQLQSQKHYDGKAFPLVVAPPPGDEELRYNPKKVCSHLQTHRSFVQQLIHKHGIVYFRAFASKKSTAEDFATFVTDGLGLSPFPYALGNAVRRNIVGDVVFTANEAPPDRKIPFHHELAQTPLWPRWLLFYCDVPSETGGETPVVHSTAVFNRLPPSFVQSLSRHGVVYRRSMTPHDRPHSAIGRGWASTFQAATREQVEQKLKEKGYSWEWRHDEHSQGQDDGELLTEISPVLPAVMDTPSGETAFFNQLYAAWTGWRDEYNSPEECVRLGNGEVLNADDMKILEKVLGEEEVAIPWERGDFMLIDNIQAMHSRRTFTGKRVVLASLAK